MLGPRVPTRWRSGVTFHSSRDIAGLSSGLAEGFVLMEGECDIVNQPSSAIETCGVFDFAMSPAGLVSVEHKAERLRWDFIVEVTNGKRFLQPMKSRMNAIDKRLTASLRRQAFAFAVAQARGRDVID